jgi:hypothetical protein
MDRFLENKVSDRICPDNQIFLRRKNDKTNRSLETNGDPVKLDGRCGAIYYLSCMMEMLGLPLTTRAPAPKLETDRLT